MNTARARDGEASAIPKMNVSPKRENKNNAQKFNLEAEEEKVTLKVRQIALYHMKKDKKGQLWVEPNNEPQICKTSIVETVKDTKIWAHFI
jgi:hypothetical protein